MIRLLIFIAIILGLGFLFSWVADRPGIVTVDIQGTEYQVSLMVAAIAIVGLVSAVMLAWGIVSTILRSPVIMSRFFKGKRRERGYQALSRGLIAASSGDAMTARRLARESDKLLANEPLVKLLDAQTSLLEGDRAHARERYAEMLSDKDTKLLALRGLYLEAEREGAEEAARHYVEEAVAVQAALPWAGDAKLRFEARETNWEAAIKTLDANRSAGLITKDEANRKKAVLLTALAFQEEGADPKKAVKHALAANKLDPDLVPAAVIGAQAYARNNDVRRASNLIEKVWQREPHPDLAQAYVHVRPGDSAADRLKRAEKLADLRANHPEGAITVALAAIDTGDFELAREKMKPIITSNLTERACLIMADIEEGEAGNQGRMREWLTRAVRAPRDPVWTADGYVSDTWMPVSPVTGEIGVFEWKVPTERLDDSTAAIDVGDLANPLPPERRLAAEDRPKKEGPSDSPASSKTEVEDDPKSKATPIEKKAEIDDHTDGDKADDGKQDTEPTSRDKKKDPVEAALAGAGMAASSSLVKDDVIDAEIVGEEDEGLSGKVDASETTPAGKNDGSSDAKVKVVTDRMTLTGKDVTAEAEIEPVPKAKSKIDSAIDDALSNAKASVGSTLAEGHRPDDPGVRPEDKKQASKGRFGLF